MRKFLRLILALAVAMSLVTGCGRAPRYDGRLVAADSLMRGNPDSALAIVQAVSSDSLTTEGDRAYRDLLLTQARYKCYITATSDSDINRALAYYRHHNNEREKLTRAYIYKGAVMEELNHPDSAMLYYKHAEATADNKDYVNLGQINTRIADLYRKNYCNEQICYKKFEKAYKYHLLSSNKNLQFNSLYNMFMMNGITRQEQQNEIYRELIKLVDELADTSRMFKVYELRCRQLLRNDTTIRQAKEIAIDCLEKFRIYINNDLLLDLAYIYAKEGKIDSALFFINPVDESLSVGDEGHVKVRKQEVMSMIAMADDNMAKAGLHFSQCSRASDSILNNVDRFGIEKIENDFNDSVFRYNNSLISLLKWTIIGVGLLVIVYSAVFFVFFLLKIRRAKFIVKELRKISIDEQVASLGKINAKVDVIEKLVANLIEVMKLSVDPRNQQSSIQMARRFKEKIIDIADDEFWNALKANIDKSHNGFISQIASQPDMKKSDVKFIELCCCGFSYIEIAIILGYSPNYISTKRKIIAKKLKIDDELDVYLKKITTTPHQTN